MIDLVSGNVQLIFATVSTAHAHMKSGRIRTIALTSAQRSDILPDVPTVAESGVPGYDLTNWFGLVIPVATPGAISKKIADDVIKVLALQDVRARFSEMGATVVGDSPPEFGAYMRAESEKWAKVIRVAGIRAQ
jgi:tripartite-type tricarboxylate transporter receptor subunit TctC